MSPLSSSLVPIPEVRLTPIEPGSVQLVMKNNTVAPLLGYKQKVMLELTGGDYSSDRPGLDLVVVVDVSKSMRGEKINQVKTSLRFLVQKLSPMDRLCVINFSYYPWELWPLRQITEASQRELQDLISKLEPSGGTDIEESLQVGLNVLADREVRVGRVAAIMLVSGGQQVNGDALLVDVGDVPVYTFCFGGTDMDSVLSAVAAKSMGGTFSHVVEQDSGALTMAFSQCLAGLLTVAVQDLELMVAAVGGESKIVTVTAGSYPQEQRKDDDDSVTVRFGNLYCTEVRKVIVELLLPKIQSERSAKILDVTYSHSHGRSAGRMKLTVWRTGVDMSEEEKPAELLSEEARLQTVEMMQEARIMADCKMLDDARNKLVEALNMSEEIIYNYSELCLVSAELQKLLELFETQETYEKQGRPYALASASSHNRQRFAGRGGDIGVMRLFATPRMDKYLEQAQKFLNDPTMPLPPSVDDDVMEDVGALTANVAIREEEMRSLALDVVCVRPELTGQFIG